MEYHVPVMVDQCIEALSIQERGIYVDVTFGGGGHSRRIYENIESGKLIAFDQDQDAAKNAKDFESDANRSFVFVPANFRYIQKYLKFYDAIPVNGIFADLGVSSHQFDVAKRGFSTRFDGNLDMRMNQNATISADEIINGYQEKELVHLFSYYGEIRNAKTLASRIIQERSNGRISTTENLKKIAMGVAPKGKSSKYLAQLFQAIRIEVNEELAVLKEFLAISGEVIKKGGRLVVISYHSLEDRLVKNFLQTGNFQGKAEKDFYGNLVRPFEPVPRKPIIPTEIEIKSNNRARSAKLRIGIKN